MSITITSGAKTFYQWERGMYLTVSSPCDILRLWRQDDQVGVELTPAWDGTTGTVKIPDRMLTESGYLFAARVDTSEEEERILEKVRIVVKAAKKPGNDASATKDVKIWETLKLQMAALERAAREGEFDGADGITPHIGENGNWFAGDIDLGVKARGDKGDKGDPGDSPYIGENGNWFVGDTDTGVAANKRDLLRHVYTSGVIAWDDPQAMAPSAIGGMKVRVAPGEVILDGIVKTFSGYTRTYVSYPGKERNAVTLCRLDKTTGEISVVYRDAVMHGDQIWSEEDTAELPIRDDRYYDALICKVTIPANATEITEDMITDLREYAQFKLKASDIENDAGYITRQAADLLNYYNKSESYNKTEVDAFLATLAQRLNSIADSDDTTLDQLSEIVAYIKANKSLIDGITTSKVNVADIIDNLETGNAVKPLSANMGKQLKALLDALEAEVSTAKSQAQTAQMMASRADTAAGSASSAAQSAQGTAEGAFQKAQSAYSMADSAYQKSQTAQGVAEGAFQKAQTAQETAEEALQKAGTGGGMGTPEVHIGAGEPRGSETLWIDTDDNSGAAASEDVYVLIDTVTMTDAAQSLRINREPDGTSYQFKAMMVKMQKPATTAGYMLQCYTYHANGKNLRTVLDFNSATAMGARIENYPRMGYFTGGGYAPSAAYSNSGTAIALPNASEAVIPIDQPITSLYFLAFGDAVIPAGSTFEIWGVRA